MTIENFSVTAAVPIIIIFLKLVLDTVGMFTVEKITLTNFKKFTIYLSQILFLTIVCQLILWIFQVPLEIEDPIVNPIIISLLGLFFIFSMAFLTVGLLAKILSIKISFYILDDLTNDKWIIKRMIWNNKLLLSNGINKFKFADLDSMNDKVIYRVYENEKIIIGQKFITSNYSIVQTILGLIVIVTSWFTWRLPEAKTFLDLVLSIALIIEYIGMMYILAAYNNEKVMREVDDETSTQNS